MENWVSHDNLVTCMDYRAHNNPICTPLCTRFAQMDTYQFIMMKFWLQIGRSDLEFKRTGEHLEIYLSTTLERPDTNGRHRRQAIIYDGTETFHDHSSHFHPPKPPKLEDTTRKYRYGKTNWKYSAPILEKYTRNAHFYFIIPLRHNLFL